MLDKTTYSIPMDSFINTNNVYNKSMAQEQNLYLENIETSNKSLIIENS